MNANEELVRVLKINAYNLYKATLVGNPCVFVERLGEELRNPKHGDLVMEITTHLRGNQMEGIGRLIRIEEEPMFTREKARELGYREDEPIPTYTAWYIKLVFDDGREFRWHNAMFIKIKEDNAQ